jgi:predicted Rossmann fold nucleotide-binding protein DprA/Smf involved in DNA uptake
MRRNLLKFLAVATLATSLFVMEASAGGGSYITAIKEKSFTVKANVAYLPDATR